MKYIKQIFLPFYLISLLVCAQQESPISNPILKLNFDNDKDTEAVKSIFGVKNIEIAPGAGVNGSDAIKANYVGYDKGSERMVKNIRLPKACKEATLNYAVKFAKDFQFPITGKLHGLGPVNNVTGGNPMHPGGWSARITFSHDGLKPYVYHQNLKGQYGVGQPAPEFHFKKGVYYDLAIHVKVNTPATANNGEVYIYVNGEKIISYVALQLRELDVADTEINNFLFSTFHGGNTPKYAPKDGLGNYTIVAAWFDDFEVYEGLYVRSLKNKNKYSLVSFFETESQKIKSLEPMDIILAIGQSNMAGRAPIADYSLLPNVYLFNGDGNFEPASQPFNKHSNIRKGLKIQGVSPGYNCMLDLQKALNKPLGLLMNAQGGSSIKLWNAPGKTNYDETIKRAKEAQKHGRITAIIWNQGSSDNKEALEDNFVEYKAKLREMVLNFRKDLNEPELPFICGELSERPDFIEFNREVVQKVKEYIPFSDYVTSEGTKLLEDNIHFDAESANQMGRRYAEKVLILTNKK